MRRAKRSGKRLLFDHMKAVDLLLALVLWLALGCGLLAPQSVSASNVLVEQNSAGTKLANGQLELAVPKEGVVSASILRDGKSIPILVGGRCGLYSGDRSLLDSLTPRLAVEQIHDPLGNPLEAHPRQAHHTQPVNRISQACWWTGP